MKKTTALVFLCLSLWLGAAQAQLKIDFCVTGGAVETGYQGYFATDKSTATFTAQSYAAFGTMVTIHPTWASGATAACIRMIDRGTDDGLDAVNLLRDWIGTDTRQPGDPMTLTIRGLPAGAYEWVSYHHDAHDQTGIFSMTISDAMGSTTIADVDISNTQGTTVNKLADVTKATATINSDGQNDVVIVFDQTSASSVTANAIFVMNGFDLTALDTGVAMVPSPAQEATDVPRDGTILSWLANVDAVAHDVYLGTDRDAVDAATTAAAVYMGRQDASTFNPGRLELGRTYYWRVDEVMADNTVNKGFVWSFTAEPVSMTIAAASILATASSVNSANEGPERTVDGSGLGDGDVHSVDTTTMWLSNPADPGPVWIQYEFNKVYQLDQMLVWNHNGSAEVLIGFGVKNATIDYSLDGAAWTTLGTTHEFARAPGEGDYVSSTTVDFGDVAAKYVRITIVDNWGGILKQYGLGEVRFLAIPTAARLPVPAVAATGVDPRSVLSWRAGREAAKHKVYLSTDVNELGSEAALAGTVSASEFDAGALLALGKTYYWRVDEVNDVEDPAVWEGSVWSFSTVASLPVDDMESYNDDEAAGTRIYETWVDGWDIPANGSQVGHNEAPFAELTILHGGKQAMPLYFDNSTAAYSEATRTFDPAQDWTLYGVKGLVLWFFGDPANTAGQMYVKVNGKKVAYDGDADNILHKPWQMWYIDLAALSGANLTKVTELTIGVEGGTGVVYIDDVALSPKDRQLITPTAPAATNLVAHYAFEGNTNDSAGKLNGTVGGAPTYVAGKTGQAIKLNGVQDYVAIEGTFELTEYSAAIWFQVEGGTGERDVISIYDTAGNHGALLEVRNNSALRALHRAPVTNTGGTDLYSNFVYTDGAWYHAVIVRSADTLSLYVNGTPAGSIASASGFNKALERITLGVLKHDSLSRYFPGAMDEMYLYSRVLSDAEIAWLAGKTKPFDKP